VLEDYYECLHHRKEVYLPKAPTHVHYLVPIHTHSYMFACSHFYTFQAAKITALQAAYRRKEAETSRDAAPTAGQIRSLGLLNRKDEEVDISKAAVLPSVAHNNAPRSGEKA
jgi:hypothetical protein